MPVIIYCYKNTREEQKIPFENIKELSRYFETEIIEAKNEYTYFETIKKHWKKKEIIIVEHDLAPTKEQILDLIYCKEPFCSYPYFLDYKRKRLSISQLNYNPMINDYSISEYPKGIFPEYADANGNAPKSDNANAIFGLSSPFPLIKKYQCMSICIFQHHIFQCLFYIEMEAISWKPLFHWHRHILEIFLLDIH